MRQDSLATSGPLAELAARCKRLEPLSEGQRRLADFLLHRFTEAAFMTARELGEQVGLSESSVVRFSTRLGFARFQDLRNLLQEAVNEHLDTTRRLALVGSGNSQSATANTVLASVLEADARNLMATLKETPHEVFEAVVALLVEAEEIYVIGLRSAESVASFLSFGLDLALPRAKVIRVTSSNVLEALSGAGSRSVVIGISVPRYTRLTVEAMDLAGERGLRRVALTDGYRSPLASRAEYVLCARSQIPSFVESFVSCLSLANALVTAVGLADRDSTRRRLADLEAIWRRHRVYYWERGQA